MLFPEGTTVLIIPTITFKGENKTNLEEEITLSYQ